MKQITATIVALILGYSASVASDNPFLNQVEADAQEFVQNIALNHDPDQIKAVSLYLEASERLLEEQELKILSLAEILLFREDITINPKQREDYNEKSNTIARELNDAFIEGVANLDIGSSANMLLRINGESLREGKLTGWDKPLEFTQPQSIGLSLELLNHNKLLIERAKAEHYVFLTFISSGKKPPMHALLMGTLAKMSAKAMQYHSGPKNQNEKDAILVHYAYLKATWDRLIFVCQKMVEIDPINAPFARGEDVDTALIAINESDLPVDNFSYYMALTNAVVERQEAEELNQETLI